MQDVDSIKKTLIKQQQKLPDQECWFLHQILCVNLSGVVFLLDGMVSTTCCILVRINTFFEILNQYEVKIISTMAFVNQVTTCLSEVMVGVFPTDWGGGAAECHVLRVGRILCTAGGRQSDSSWTEWNTYGTYLFYLVVIPWIACLSTDD